MMKKWLLALAAALMLMLPCGQLHGEGNAGTYNTNMYGAKTGLQRAGQVDERVDGAGDGRLHAAQAGHSAVVRDRYDWRWLSGVLVLAGAAGALYFNRRKRS
ncbi:hypothetical protein [Paenibacillus silvisoli]|uniref:hypothetical protein n=1 Tax=Paenibacillus silvisoli TaxID=3110539 RepID=UPI002803BCF1|nr:hypothetical protein [Paenibacillus silvisoli]